jgi:large repetitive protein
VTNLGADGTVFFTADDGGSGQELWKSDGTEAGTVRIKDINPGVGESFPLDLVNVNGTLLFNARDGSSGFELWKSDGKEKKTIILAEIAPGPASSSPGCFTVSRKNIFFRADDGVTGRELWVIPGFAGTCLSRLLNVHPKVPGGYKVASPTRSTAQKAYL